MAAAEIMKEPGMLEEYDPEGHEFPEEDDQVESNVLEAGCGKMVLEPLPLSHQVFGTAAIWLGATLLLIAGCESFGGDLSFLPRFWYVNRTIWIGLGIMLIPAGVAIQVQRQKRRKTWQPTQLGRRFDRLRIYSRPGCHLCDIAVELLTDPQYSPYLPEPEVVNIETNPEWRQRFHELIPVVEFDGKIRFTGRVEEVLLRRLIEGTLPTTKECHRRR